MRGPGEEFVDLVRRHCGEGAYLGVRCDDVLWSLNGTDGSLSNEVYILLSIVETRSIIWIAVVEVV